MRYIIYTESGDKLFYDPTSWILPKDNEIIRNDKDLIEKTVEFSIDDEKRISSVKK